MPENSNQQIETVKRLYAALNRDDIPAVLSFFSNDAVRVETEGFPPPGTYRGLAEIEAHFRQGRGTWAEGGCEPEKILAKGDRLVVLVHVKVRLKDRPDWLEGRTGDVFTFRGDKIIEFRTFIEQQKALEWAGVENADGSAS
jgi:ketosteroid isomerase-like protein